MPLRFKELLAQGTRFTIVLMEQLAAWVTMESINVVQLLTLFVVKTEFPVAAMEQLAVPHLVAVLFLMVFVVKMAAVAPMEPNVLAEGGPVQSHNFCPWRRYISPFFMSGIFWWCTSLTPTIQGVLY